MNVQILLQTESSSQPAVDISISVSKGTVYDHFTLQVSKLNKEQFIDDFIIIGGFRLVGVVATAIRHRVIVTM